MRKSMRSRSLLTCMVAVHRLCNNSFHIIHQAAPHDTGCQLQEQPVVTHQYGAVACLIDNVIKVERVSSEVEPTILHTKILELGLGLHAPIRARHLPVSNVRRQQQHCALMPRGRRGWISRLKKIPQKKYFPTESIFFRIYKLVNTGFF